MKLLNHIPAFLKSKYLISFAAFCVIVLFLDKNDFFTQVQQAENNAVSAEELQKLLGKGRAKRGMFEGDTEEGELEIGQVCAIIKEIKPAADIVEEMYKEYSAALRQPVK